MKFRFSLIFASLPFLLSCTTNLHLYDRDDAPFFCEQRYQGPYKSVSDDYVPYPLSDRYLDFYVLRNKYTDEFVVVKNKLDFVVGNITEYYDTQWFEKTLIGAKVLIQADMNGGREGFGLVVDEIRSEHPNAKIRRPSLVDVSILPFSPWLAVDYAKKPCEGMLLGDLFLEFRLLKNESFEFRQLDKETLILGISLNFTDYPSGWRFSRTLSVSKKDLYEK